MSQFSRDNPDMSYEEMEDHWHSKADKARDERKAQTTLYDKRLSSGQVEATKASKEAEIPVDALERARAHRLNQEKKLNG
jgi:hypothetical protein